ncbi:junctophilin-like protein isoform X2 [Carex rostrata]
MASGHPALTEIGPDGLARESPVIAYTEKVIAAEQLQLKKYIQENYSKIRDVERELEGLNLEMKLTAGPKKAALEYLRKKIEIATERIRVAKLKEEQAKKAWEAAQQALKEEEAAKQKLCDDLNSLVQESAASQFSRLEELKKRLEALNPSRISTDATLDPKTNAQNQTSVPAPVSTQEPNSANVSTTTPQNPTITASNKVEAQSQKPATSEAKEKRRPQNSGRGGRGSLILSKGRGNGGSGWTGAGFDVDLGS